MMSMQVLETTDSDGKEGSPVPAHELSAERGVYAISVAAEIVGMGVQTLRLYESRGLLQPDRTDGGTRRYSANDLDRLRRIGQLLDAGLNLSGISMVLDLESENAQLRAEKEEQRWLKPARIGRARSRTQTPSTGRGRRGNTRD